MSIATSQTTVTPTATLVYTAPQSVEVRIKLIFGDGYFGPDSSLTVANGYYLAGPSGGEQKFTLTHGDTVYGVSIGATALINILAIT